MRLKNFAKTFATDLEFTLIRRRVEKHIVEGAKHGKETVYGLMHIVNEFTPEGLQRFINDGKSLIPMYESVVSDSLMRLALDALSSNTELARRLVLSLNWQHILEILAKHLPAQARVVKKNPQWYHGEQRRATKVFMGLLRRSRG